MALNNRANSWSITIMNPTPLDLSPNFPAGWRMEGQMETAPTTGTPHYQGMLHTPQVRMSAVKKLLPRAKILPARNSAALQNYVHKEETRLAEVPTITSPIPSLFDYQGVVAANWDDEEFGVYTAKWHAKLPDTKDTIDDVAMEYLDHLVSLDIASGMKGVEYIAVNPMWRSSWKRFWPSIIARSRLVPPPVGEQTNEGQQTEDRQTDSDGI